MNEVFQLRLRLFGTEELADRDLKWLKHIKKTLSLKVPTVPKPPAHPSQPVTPPAKRKRDDAGEASPSVKPKKTKPEKKEAKPPVHETPKTPPKPLQKKTKIILKTRRAPSPTIPKEQQMFNELMTTIPKEQRLFYELMRQNYLENIERVPEFLDRASQVPYVNDDEEIEI